MLKSQLAMCVRTIEYAARSGLNMACNTSARRDREMLFSAAAEDCVSEPPMPSMVCLERSSQTRRRADSSPVGVSTWQDETR